MIVTLLNIASDLTLNIAWWATKTIASGLYSVGSYLVTKDNLLEKGCTKNQDNLLEKGCTKNQDINNDERITILMNKIDKLLENNLLEKDSLLEKGCTKN